MRPPTRKSLTPPFSTRLRLLDGPRGGQAGRVHEESRHMECWLFDRRDAYGRAPLGSTESNASHFQGTVYPAYTTESTVADFVGRSVLLVRSPRSRPTYLLMLKTAWTSASRLITKFGHLQETSLAMLG